MLTIEKLSLYRRFDGDRDAWEAGGRPGPRDMTSADWIIIGHQLQRLGDLRERRMARERALRARESLATAVDDADTALELWSMASPGTGFPEEAPREGTVPAAGRPSWEFW